MQLSIDNRSDQPIYEQIALQIKAQIISGALAEDTLLPSIRSLAKDLRISVITTKRAYEELERLHPRANRGKRRGENHAHQDDFRHAGRRGPIPRAGTGYPAAWR